jgi:IS30 family transposase
MTYHHLSLEERYKISALLKEGLTQSQIAPNLSRHKATIGREIARNSGLRGYRPRQASILASGRSINSRNARQIDPSDWLSAEAFLKRQWSPEQIAAEVPISHETIYRHIYADKAQGGVLYKHLRSQKKNDVNGLREAGTEGDKSLVVGLFLNGQAILRSVARLDIGRETR